MNDVRGIQCYIVLYACGEILREFLHLGFYSFRYIQRVAARLLVYGNGSSGFSVQLRDYAVGGRAQVNVRHVAQAEYLPSCFGAQNDVAELFGRSEAAFYGQAVLVSVFIVGTDGLPYVSRTDFHILRLNGLVYIGRRKVADAHGSRVEPDAYGIVPRSHHIDGTHTGHACQLVHKIQLGVVAEVKSVIVFVVRLHGEEHHNVR